MTRAVLAPPAEEALAAPGVVAGIYNSRSDDADWIIALADGRRFRWPGEYGPPPVEVGAEVELVRGEEVGT